MERTGDNSSDRDKGMMDSFKGPENEPGKKEKKKTDKTDKSTPIFEFPPQDKKPEIASNLLGDKKPRPENKPETTALDVEDITYAAGQYVAADITEANQERKQAPENSVQEAKALAEAALLENIQEGLNEEGPTPDSIDEFLDQKLNQTAKELDLEPDDETPQKVVSPLGFGGPPSPPSIRPAVPMGGMPNPDSAPASPNILPSSEVLAPRHSRGGDILLGVVAGYLMGRHRGRVKAEHRLLPEQQKLKKEVKTLYSKIAERQDKIRELAREKFNSQPEAIRPVLIERWESRRERKVEQKLPKRPELLGQVILPRAEVVPPLTREVEPKRVELMTMPELLGVAQKIEVGGVNVRQMFEAGRLDSVGLRRVIGEFLSGRRVETVLAENLRRYESPEYLKPVGQSQSGGGLSGGGGAAFGGSAPKNSPAKLSSLSGRVTSDQPGDFVPSSPKRQTPLPVPVIIAILLGLLIAVAFLIT